MQKGQIILAIGTVVLAIALYFGTSSIPKKNNGSSSTTNQSNLSFDDYEQQQLNKVDNVSKASYQKLLVQIKNVKPNDSSERQKFLNIATFWKQQHNDALASYYIYMLAKNEKSVVAWQNAGDVLFNSFKNNRDSIISNKLLTFAQNSYENAVQLDSTVVETKIKLAELYVQGTQEPMKGIGILRSIIEKEPNNIAALLALARMSILSGQYDKAKGRLQQILQIDNQNTEAIYFLGITEAELGHKEEAVKLLEMCKKMVENPEFSKEIDTYIENLKK